MQKITPFLWFNDNAEEAMNFYMAVFKDSKTGKVVRYDEAGAKATGRPVGSVMTATFMLNGQDFIALNGGPHFRFTEAVSFVINCTTQEEIDYYWEKLAGDGGEPGRCGWLKDKFGLSWQVVPEVLGDLFANSEPGKAQRIMAAMLQMDKMNIKQLQEA